MDSAAMLVYHGRSFNEQGKRVYWSYHRQTKLSPWATTKKLKYKGLSESAKPENLKIYN